MKRLLVGLTAVALAWPVAAACPLVVYGSRDADACELAGDALP